MIKIALKNINFLKTVLKIPILKHFFIIKVSKSFSEINSSVILDKFYKDVYVSEKTSKKTHKNRFNDINKTCLKHFNNLNEIIIHDIAVSSGISSIEFSDFLKKNRLKFKLNISDKYAEVYVKEGFITKTFCSENNLLFAYYFVFFAGDKNKFFPLTVLLFKLIQNQKLIDEHDYRLLLFHPRVLKSINKNEISYIYYDVFNTKIYNLYTFVRAMNILNLSYFSEEKIKIAIENILNSLKEGGILLIGRTLKNGINNASLYKKQNNKLILIEDINSGTEVKHIINNL